MSLSTLFSEFFALMTPGTIFNAFWATGFGIIVGMLPGLTATMNACWARLGPSLPPSV